MADIVLQKPVEGAQTVLDSVNGANIVLDFPIADAVLERTGNDLVFHFNDGSNLVLRNFYTAYTKDSMPDFVIEGTPVTGEQFFAALNEPDLMPAAGPAAASTAAGGRFHDFSNAALLDGVDRLGGLDLGLNRAFYPDRELYGAGTEGTDATVLTTDTATGGTTPSPSTPGGTPDAGTTTPDSGSTGGTPSTPSTPGTPAQPDDPLHLSVSGSLNVVESGVFPGGNDANPGVQSMSGTAAGNGSFGLLDADGKQVSQITTEYGTMQMAPDGTYTYIINNGASSVDSLALGETRTETFTVFVTNEKGELVTQTVTVTITGTNDAPTLALDSLNLDVVESGVGRVDENSFVNAPGTAAENTPYTLNGSASGAGLGLDVDHNAVLTYGAALGQGTVQYNASSAGGSSEVVIKGEYGTLTLHADGSYIYTLTEGSDALSEGASASETFTIAVRDEHGAWASKPLTVTIHGTNDMPELSIAGSGQTLAEGNPGDTGTVSGTFTVVDPDSDAGTHRTFQIAGGEGTTLTSGAANVQWSTGGSNSPATVTTDYGSLTLSPDGTWTYALNNNSDVVQQLNAGETRTQTFTVTVIDEHGANQTQTITVTITGTNDNPVIGAGSVTALEFKEEGVYQETPGGEGNASTVEGGLGDGQHLGGTLTGQITATDVDSENGAGSSDHAVNNLTFGVTHQSTVLAGNGTTSGLTGGTGAAGSGDVTYEYQSDYGTLTFNKDGSYSYTLKDGSDTDNAVNKLGLGQTVTETFTVTVTDASGGTATQNITITIHGTNDKPTLDLKNDEGKTTLDVIEEGVGRVDENNFVNAPGTAAENEVYDKHGSASGTAIGADVDDGAKLSYSVAAGDTHGEYNGDSPSATATGTYGNLTIDANGKYTYTLTDGSNRLSEDEKVSETFTIYVRDEHNAWTAQTITVNVTGTNDIPTLTIGTTVPGVTEDANADAVARGTFSVSDDDNDAGTKQTFKIASGDDETILTSNPANVEWDTKTPSASNADATVTTDYGKLTLSPNGEWKYELDNTSKAVQELPAGQTKTETFTVTVIDEHGANATQNITVTITGTNDAPVVEDSTTALTLKEAGVFDKNTPTIEGTNPADGTHVLSQSGKINASDIDNGDTLKFSLSDGKHTFVETGTANSVTDSNLSDTLTLVGGNQTYPGTNNPAQVYQTTYGTLTIDTVTGDYTYTLNQASGADTDAVNRLPEGVSVVETFTVTVSDGHTTVDVPITITVQGTNEQPTIEHVNNTDGTIDDGILVFERTEDNGETLKNITGQVVATDADSDNGAGAATDSDVVTDLTFSIQGMKSSETAGVSGLPEKVTSGTTSETTYETNYGKLTLDASTGKYTFTPNEDVVNHLGVGQSISETFTIRVTDAHGAYSEIPIKINIKGTNDNPTIASSTGKLEMWEQGVDEKNVEVKKENTLSGSVGADDVDTGDKENLIYFFDPKHTVDSVIGTVTKDGVTTDVKITSISTDGKTLHTNYGTFELKANGDYTFTPIDEKSNNGENPLNALNLGDKVELNITIGVKDNHGAEAKNDHDVTVIINGFDDRPTASVSVGALKEEGVQHGGNEATKLDTDGTVIKDGAEHQTKVTGEFGKPTDYDDAVPDKNYYGLGEGQFKIDITGVSYVGKPTNDSNGNYTFSHVLGTNHNGDLKVIKEILSDPSFPKEKLAELKEALDDPITDEALSKVVLATFHLNADGSYTYTLASDGAGALILDMLGQGYNSSRTVKYTVTDPHGGVSEEKSFTLTIYGTNDKPELELKAGNNITVDGTTGTATITLDGTGGTKEISGIAHGTDVDTGHVLNYGAVKGSDTPDSLKDIGFTNGNGTETTVEGIYGKLTITIDANQQATYTYVQDNGLVYGEKYTDNFVIFVKDEKGAWASQKVEIDVTGAPDAPVVTKSLDALVTEITEAGVVFNTNDDVSEKVSIGGGPKTDLEENGFLGSFTVKQMDSADSTGGKGQLVAGFILKGEFHAGEIDTDYGKLTVTVDQVTGVVSYHFVIPAEGSDAYLKYNALTPNDRIKLFEKLGSLQIGVYDSKHAGLVGANGADDNGNFKISVDGMKWFATQNTDIYIHGTNDRPFFTTSGTDNDYTDVSNDGLSDNITLGTDFIKGQFFAKDYDKGDNEILRFTIVEKVGDEEHLVQSIPGKYGILTITDAAKGTYTYTLYEEVAKEHQNLNPDQFLQDEKFTVRVTDFPKGSYSDTTLTINVNGAEDKAAISADAVTVQEDGGYVTDSSTGSITSGEGKLTLNAVDDQDKVGGATHYNTWTVKDADGRNVTLNSADVINGKFIEVKGEHGHLEFTFSNGEWHYKYVLDNNSAQSMAKNETLTEKFEVTASNGTTTLLTTSLNVTITGTNDKPTITSEVKDLMGEITAGVFDDTDTSDLNPEKTGVVFTGQVHGEDKDHALDKDGNATDVTETTSLKYYFLIMVNGKEVLTTVVEGKYGSFTINPSTGEYTYLYDQQKWGNNPGFVEKTFDETVKVVAVDIHNAKSEPQTITITLNRGDDSGGGDGTDDKTINIDNSVLEGATKEDGGTGKGTSEEPTQIFEGHLDAVKKPSTDDGTSEDVDDHVFSIIGADGKPVQTATGKYGYITIDPATGKWKYTLFNDRDDVQNLGEGEVVKEEFNIALDGKPLMNGEDPITIDVTVTGTNDKPVISEGNYNISLTEQEGGYEGSTTGRINATDDDHVVDGNGNKVENEVDGNHLTYTIVDENGEEVSQNADGSYNLTYGTVTIDKDTGVYTYTPNENLPHLPLGQKYDDPFYVKVSDGHDGGDTIQKVDVTINGVNHAPEFTGTVLNVQEDVITTDTKQGITDDKDNNLTFYVDGKPIHSLTNEYGMLQLNKNGTYTFILNNQSEAVQKLGEGEPHEVNFNFTVRDSDNGETQAKVTVNITGTNDQPIAAVERVIVAKEGDEDSHETTILAKDADAGDKLTYTFNQKYVDDHTADGWKLNGDGSLTTQYGTYTIVVDENGKATVKFEINNDSKTVIELKDKQLAQETVKVDVSDDSKAENSTTQVDVTVNIEGANSAPVELTLKNSNNADAPLVEDGAGTFTGTASANDLDTDVPPTYGFKNESGGIVTSIEGKYGTITINPKTGDYTYTLDSTDKNEALNSLADGAIEKETFQIVAMDGSDSKKVSAPQELEISIKGTNDAPVISGSTSSDLDGSFTLTDVDTGDTHSVTFTGLTSEDGKGITVDLDDIAPVDVYDGATKVGTLIVTYKDGKVGYTLTPDSDYTSTFTDSKILNFSVQVSDHSGETNADSNSLSQSFTVTGTNTAPSVLLDNAVDYSQVYVAKGSFTVSDAEGDSVNVSPGVGAAYGTVEISADGSSYTYTLDPAKFSAGEMPASDSFTITVTDEHGASHTETISVNLGALQVPEPIEEDGLVDPKPSDVVTPEEGTQDKPEDDGEKETSSDGDGDPKPVEGSDSNGDDKAVEGTQTGKQENQGSTADTDAADSTSSTEDTSENTTDENATKPAEEADKDESVTTETEEGGPLDSTEAVDGTAVMAFSLGYEEDDLTYSFNGEVNTETEVTATSLSFRAVNIGHLIEEHDGSLDNVLTVSPQGTLSNEAGQNVADTEIPMPGNATPGLISTDDLVNDASVVGATGTEDSALHTLTQQIAEHQVTNAHGAA